MADIEQKESCMRRQQEEAGEQLPLRDDADQINNK